MSSSTVVNARVSSALSGSMPAVSVSSCSEGSSMNSNAGLQPAELPAGGRKGGMAGRTLGLRVDANPEGASSPVLAGDDALLALAGGRPVGVEGRALFLPFLGGVVDIDGACYGCCRRC